VLCVVTDLIGIAERCGEQPLVERLEQKRMLAPRESNARQPDHLLVAHGIADDGKGLLPDLIGRREIIGAVEIALVDFRAWNEAVDLDRAAALDPDLLEFLVLDEKILTLRIFVAATNVLP